MFLICAFFPKEYLATQDRQPVYYIAYAHIYIGKRKGNFDSHYFGSGLLIKQAIQKYSKNQFKVEFLKCSQSKEGLSLLEIEYIAMYRKLFPKDIMYNIARGGDGGSTWLAGQCPLRVKENLVKGQQKRKEKYGYVISPEVREKHNKAMRNNNPNKRPEIREKISNALKGRHFSKQHRINIGKSLKGRTPWNKGLKGIIKI